MMSLITTCLLLVNAVASLAVPQELTLKIVSPAPGTKIQPGVSLNVTLQIEKVAFLNSSQHVVLGFGLNSADTQNPTSLGEVFLGLLNTTHTPFNASGHLSWSLSIPAREKFNSTAISFSLVVSQYIFSGASNTPHCGIVSVPVEVALGGSDPAGSGKGANQPALPAGPSTKLANMTDPTHMTPGSPVHTVMNATSSTPTSQPGESEIKASITAKGHNTADTIPGTAAGDKSVPSQMNVTSAATIPSEKTGNVTTSTTKRNGTSESESGAAHLGISTSHMIAGTAVILGIFATV
ncbi:hypothetical protein PCANC_12384 [Puccinia coronata f. sp. avenae]|uniref:Reelin domain-containing protein n=1 Tax=Puccinia coronata f. sp. avenae TaxID=200324 RepID=A0A2N5SHX5_9BASI|nr:hypothetical protein PCASD_25029 [Puccinia coronata f. sp. avenae]PLW12815.1 hypothetical protein PCANC_16877 [Puccinia coronata f. sp. avenae]PLW41160.1 hypothetical protein PCANC_12384 [Puccinia coronata f. sp. avenae]PLW50349.1 hypothetical protein PCASD_01691 [Puccinia coronata f. sp. avenae]